MTSALSIVSPLLDPNTVFPVSSDPTDAPALRAALALARALKWRHLAVAAETREAAEAFSRLTSADEAICVVEEIIVAEQKE